MPESSPADPNPGTTKVSFPRLDGLRALCFLAVFFAHQFVSTDPAMQEDPVIYFLKWSVFSGGGMGVNVFFVLSGFLITWLLMRERDITGRIHVPHFWLRRVLRIWPLYFFCVLFGFVIFPVIKVLFGQTPQETAQLWHYLTFTSNFDVLRNGDPDATILFMLWSVAVEEQFYAFWPLLLLLTGKRGAPFLFGSVMLFALSFRLSSGKVNEIYFHTFSCIGDMATGALAAWIFARPGWPERIARWPSWWVILIHVLFIILFFTRVPMIDHGAHAAPLRTLTAVLAALIVLCQVAWTGRWMMIPTTGFLTYIGRISYGLYCLHPIGCLISLQVVRMMGLQSSLFGVIFIQTVIAFVCSIAIAALSYRYFELPFLRLKERFAVVHR